MQWFQIDILFEVRSTVSRTGSRATSKQECRAYSPRERKKKETTKSDCWNIAHKLKRTPSTRVTGAIIPGCVTLEIFMVPSVLYKKREREGKFSRRAHAKNTSRRIILSRGGIIEFAQDVFQVIARITLRESRARARFACTEKKKDYTKSFLAFVTRARRGVRES